LPTPGIGKDNLPGLFGLFNGFGREEIPGFASIAWARNDQEELALIVRQVNRASDDTGPALATSAGIPNQTLFPGTLAAHDLPDFLFASIGSQQVIPFVPAQDETEMVIQGQSGPGTAGKATIPDVEYLPTPYSCHFAQDFAFFYPLLAGFFSPGGPPTQVR